MLLAFQVLLAVLVPVAAIGVIAHCINKSEAANADPAEPSPKVDKPA